MNLYLSQLLYIFHHWIIAQTGRNYHWAPVVGITYTGENIWEWFRCCEWISPKDIFYKMKLEDVLENGLNPCLPRIGNLSGVPDMHFLLVIFCSWDSVSRWRENTVKYVWNCARNSERTPRLNIYQLFEINKLCPHCFILKKTIT